LLETVEDEKFDMIGWILMFGGIVLFFVLPFMSAWKAHYKKEKVSPKALTRHSIYLGGAVIIFGLGFILDTWQDGDTEAWLISKIITGFVCLVISPLLMMAVYILDMKWGGYVENSKS